MATAEQEITIAQLRAGAQIEGVFACTRKDRLTARSGTPYLAVELRDRSGSIQGRAFREADFLAGQFDRGDLVAVEGRVERFRDELQVELRSIRRTEAADPAAFLPPPTATSTSSTGSSSTSPARSTTQTCAPCSTPFSETPPSAPSCAALPARAPATTPTSAACSSTRSRWPRSRSRRACCIRASTPTC